jgi:hypothetical protein
MRSLFYSLILTLILSLFGCLVTRPFQISLGMSVSEFKLQAEEASHNIRLCNVGDGREVYQDNSNRKYYYFQDGKLTQIDTGQLLTPGINKNVKIENK